MVNWMIYHGIVGFFLINFAYLFHPQGRIHPLFWYALFAISYSLFMISYDQCIRHFQNERYRILIIVIGISLVVLCIQFRLEWLILFSGMLIHLVVLTFQSTHYNEALKNYQKKMQKQLENE